MAYAQANFSEREIEFLGEFWEIPIVPRFSCDSLDLIQGVFGPFLANVPISVPLWIALHLKRSKQCRIVAPEWLSLDSLTKTIEGEKSDETLFMPLPSHFFEIASMLFNDASDDIANATKVKAALATLSTLRDEKIRSGLEQLQPGFTWAKLNNLSQLELNKVRSYTVNALDQFYELSNEAAVRHSDDMGESQSQSQTQALRQS